MGSTPERSFIKGICWEIISFFLTLLVIFILYGDIIISLKITIILTVIKMPIYFIHERIWKKFKWGKTKDGKKNSNI